MAIEILLPKLGLTMEEGTVDEWLVDDGARITVGTPLLRLATDGANRMATFTLPTIRDNLIAGRPSPLGMLMLAAWAEYWARIASGAVPADAVPPDALGSQMATAAGSTDPLAFIGIEPIFGGLAGNGRFRDAFAQARAQLVELGVHGAIEAARTPG